MNSDPLWLVSFLLSSSLAFFSAAFIVEVSIPLFRITKHRVRSLLRLFPMVSLPIDYFLHKLSVGNLLNPLHCDSCVQKLFLHFTPELKGYLAEHEIAWSRHLASQMPNLFFIGVAVVFGALTTLILFRKMVQIISFHQGLRAVIKRADICARTIENQSLSVALQKKGVKILESDEIPSPLAACLRTILIPKNLVELLSQDEFEAVISHELEHLRWRDPMLKLLFEIEAALYWWVPTKWWLKRVNQDQEMSADASVGRYKLEETALASALVKIAGDRRQRSKLAAFCTFAVEKIDSLWVRLQMIVNPLAAARQKSLLKAALFGLAFGGLILLGCMM